jgi:hypothetical protein
VAHSLSAPVFRWTYDNNPLIAVTIACLLLGLWRLPWMLRGPALAALLLSLTTLLVPMVPRWQATTEPWPEVPYLAGARMQSRAAPIRALIAEVRALTPDADATVLMLPEDPDVLAMIDRHRPRLTPAILFVDQYWDRFVDADLRRLRAKPPAVILLGPEQNLWAQTYYSGLDVRTHRLWRALLPLLATRYEDRGVRALQREDGRPDSIHVYVRRRGVGHQ